MKYTSDILFTELEAAGFSPDARQRDAIRDFGMLLLGWNQHINLISRKDEDQLWLHHILHSLLPLLQLRLPQKAQYIDIGSGGGLPGIPLAIMLPEASFVLVDSVGKKIRAVEQISAELRLTNVRCIHGRVEEQASLRGSTDVVLARGVTRLLTLVQWSWPLLRRGGERLLVAWKGGTIDEEFSEILGHAAVKEVSVSSCEMVAESYFLQKEKLLVEVCFRDS